MPVPRVVPKLLIPSIAGGVFGAVAWSVVNGLERINGLGFLERLAWPLSTPISFVVAGALAALVAAAARLRLGEARSSALAEVAARLSFDFEPGEHVVPPEDRPPVLLYRDWREAADRMSGKTADGDPIEIFSLELLNKGGDGGSISRWIVVQFDGVDLPAFAVHPVARNPLARLFGFGLSFDFEAAPHAEAEALAEFDRTYRVALQKDHASGDALSPEAEVRSWFVARRLRALLDTPGRRIESADGRLVVATDAKFGPEAYPELIRNAIRVRRDLTAPVDPATDVELPPRPGMEQDRVDRRRSGGTVGAIVGGALGFFGGFAAFAAAMFATLGRPGPAGPVVQRIFFAFPFVVFGSALVGGFVGFRIGGGLADRTYRPGAHRRPVPTGWVIGGGFAGWVMGMLAAGLLLAIAFPGGNAGWSLPLLVFGPPVGCLVLGTWLGRKIGAAILEKSRIRKAGEPIPPECEG